MTHYRNKYFLMVLAATLMLTSACKKQWSQRDAVVDQQLNINLMQQIQANGNLSVFAGYLTKIGFDKVLSASKTYTVFAPSNAALANIDPAIVADTAKLHVFVANHIANQTYLTTSVQTSLRVRNLNGKNVTLTPTTVEDANITSANQYVSNGVVNVIDKMLTPRLNISQFVRSLTTVGALQRDYVIRQDSTFIDTSKATVASINPTTGKPVLVPNTGVVTINKYFNKVANLANEDSTYTYIVLTDAAYTAERNKVSKYFATSSVDTTMNILAGFNVLKDVAIRGTYTLANMPATLTSVNGVPVPFDKTAVVQTYNASNGIVYVMSAVNFNVSDKITPITIQGEQPSFYARTDKGGNTQLRSRLDNNLVKYNDLYISGTGIASYFAAYKLSNLYTCQYKVVIRAINDTAVTHIPAASPTLGNISEKVTFGQITATTNPTGAQVVPVTAVNYPYQNVPPYVYTEITQTPATAGTVAANATINVASGNLNVIKYNSIYMYVTGANVTTSNLNNVIVDYIKLIPIIQ
ncbi:fasciclin domain-containing protein [Mucilaginibacter mali]|uniref:Fasciclin domain-containing protein n=1 Tax=Mucilaginibacter mali TaxID=2740462 RepID=A0A7D4UJY1_9SPHI|nr:fasciclin domain-containing protein [Mucilaginibacter mali]QKJ29762.1 fasciclin domain-containing protein [Mucilaginibacter mali]